MVTIRTVDGDSKFSSPWRSVVPFSNMFLSFAFVLILLAIDVFSWVGSMETLIDHRLASVEGLASKKTVSWCDKVKTARSTLHSEIHITVPCDTMSDAKSAVVVYMTAGLPDGKGNSNVFTVTDYVNGALALGASLQDHITRKDVHQLLLLREGFMIPEDKVKMLEAVGWTLGKAPKVEVPSQYVPRNQRYKTVYSKISVIGLSEYDCVLLLDADTLVVGNLDELISCTILEPGYRVAGTLDYYRSSWYHFNTGSALWKPSAQEMNRVYGLTRNATFMQRFQSDQIFTNTVYPDRTNRTLNTLILKEEDEVDGNIRSGNLTTMQYWGQVANLGWKYNAQTHVEYQLPEFWEANLQKVKIIHYTKFKGWQCPERHGGPPSLKQKFIISECDKTPGCACNEGYRWYDYLDVARTRAKISLSKVDCYTKNSCRVPKTSRQSQCSACKKAFV